MTDNYSRLQPPKTQQLRPTIHLALTDDWELRGDGSGDIAQIQFAPMRKLLAIFGRFGARTTFNVEVMQQLAFRRFQVKHPELRRLADEWDEYVREAIRQGHDVQLHIHPQWSRVEYSNGKWTLTGDWSLTNYDADAARSMLSDSKQYVEELLRPIDFAYRCVSFRAGSSSIAPSEHSLKLLAELGIVLDMSIVGGLRVNTRNLRIDYTDCEEDFLPFYPQMHDARKLSEKPQPIICVPIFNFTLSRRRAFLQTASKAGARAARKFSSGAKRTGPDADYSNQEWAEIGSSRFARIYDKAIKPSLLGKHVVADIGQLDYAGLTEMLTEIRRRARDSGLPELPVILTNHSKYIGDFSAIEHFVEDVSKAEDLRFTTLSDIARKLQAGEFPVRIANS